VNIWEDIEHLEDVARTLRFEMSNETEVGRAVFERRAKAYDGAVALLMEEVNRGTPSV